MSRASNGKESLSSSVVDPWPALVGKCGQSLARCWLRVDNACHHGLGIGGVSKLDIFCMWLMAEQMAKLVNGRFAAARRARPSALSKTGALDQILRQPDINCLLAFIDPAGQHHVDHPCLADQISHADGRAAAVNRPREPSGKAK